MQLVTGTAAQLIATEEAADKHAGSFDVVMEASGVFVLVLVWGQGLETGPRNVNPQYSSRVIADVSLIT
jgi:hypothetical protein